MENLILSLNVVLPLFITMSLGYFLKSLNMFDNNTLDTMNNITFKSFLPMLLFYSIYKKKRSPFFGDLIFLLSFAALSEQFYLFGREFLFRVNVEEPTQGDAERAHDKDYVVNPIYIAVMQRFCKGKTEKSDNRPYESDNVREPLFRHCKAKYRRHKAYMNSANGTRNSLFIA